MQAGGHSSPPPPPTSSSRHHGSTIPQTSGVGRSSVSTHGSPSPPLPLHPHKMLTTLQMGGENSAFTPTRGNNNNNNNITTNSSDLNGGSRVYPTSSPSPTSSVSEINVHEESVHSGDDDEDERLDVVGGVDLSPTSSPKKTEPEDRPPVGLPQLALSAVERVAAWRQAELASRILLSHPRRE